MSAPPEPTPRALTAAPPALGEPRAPMRAPGLDLVENQAFVSRLKTATLVRALVATVYFVSVQLSLGGESPSYQLTALAGPIKWLTVGVYLYSFSFVLAYLGFRRSHHLRSLLPAQTLLDAITVTVYAAFTGWSGSFFTVFYFGLIFWNATVTPRRWFAATIVLTGALYSMLVVLEVGLQPLTDLFGRTVVPLNPTVILSNVMINGSAFIGVSVLSGYYARFVSRVESERVSYKKLQQIHEHLVQVMPLGLLVTDLGGTVTLTNRHGRTLAGVSEGQMEGRHVARVFRSLKPILGNDDKLRRGVNEVTHELVGGEKRRLRWNISRLEDERGLALGNLLLFEDTTALYKLEKRTKRMEEMAIIGRLAAGIVHEIRNPLASISGSIQVLSQLDSLPEDERNLTRIILREVEHLGQWTDEFLSYARPKEPEKHDVDMAEVIDDVVTLFRQERGADRRIEVETRLPVGVHALIDPNQVRRAIRNVLANARDALGEQGRIVVTLERLAGHVRVRIVDDGPGMTRDQIEHVVEPFYTTKEAGTGLGLSIVQRIVEAHGGALRIDSTPGQGTVVEIALPSGESPVTTGVFERPTEEG